MERIKTEKLPNLVRFSAIVQPLWLKWNQQTVGFTQCSCELLQISIAYLLTSSQSHESYAVEGIFIINQLTGYWSITVTMCMWLLYWQKLLAALLVRFLPCSSRSVRVIPLHKAFEQIWHWRRSTLAWHVTPFLGKSHLGLLTLGCYKLIDQIWLPVCMT